MVFTWVKAHAWALRGMMVLLTAACTQAVPRTPTDSSSPTVQVSVGQGKSESGRDDLGVLRAFFASASRGDGNVSEGDAGGGIASTWRFARQIGVERLRAINTEDGCRLDGQGNFVPCGRLSDPLEEAERLGLRPHVVVGIKKPDFIPGDGSDWDAARWDTYRDYAYKLVRWIASESGAPPGRRGSGFDAFDLEPTNEWDIAQGADTVWPVSGGGSVPQYDPRRYEAFLRVYRVWAEAVNRVSAEFPRKKIRVGGPATGWTSSFVDGKELWHEKLIRERAHNGLRLDWLTYHFYGDFAAVGNGVMAGDVPPFKEQIRRIEKALKDAGLDLPISATEWGVNCCNDPEGSGVVNYNHEGAAWTAAFLLDALAGGLDEGVYLLFRDNWSEQTTGDPMVQSFTHLRDGKEYPKPIFNVARMFSLLPGSRKAVRVDAARPNLGAFASADAGGAGLVVYNYRYEWNYDRRVFGDRSSEEKDLTVRFDGLPFSGPVTVERYLIDAQTSNLAKFLDAGQTPVLEQTELERREAFAGDVRGGRLTLGPVTLGKSAVSLWLVRPKP